MEWPAAWREAASLGDMRLRLTPAQTEAMLHELEAVIERYLTAGPESSAQTPPKDVADVFVLLDVFPTREAKL